MSEQNETLQTEENPKIERLEMILDEITESLMGQVPAPYQMAVKNMLLPQFYQRFRQLTDSDIDVFIEKAKGLIAYVEHGDSTDS